MIKFVANVILHNLWKWVGSFCVVDLINGKMYLFQDFELQKVRGKTC